MTGFLLFGLHKWISSAVSGGLCFIPQQQMSMLKCLYGVFRLILLQQYFWSSAKCNYSSRSEQSNLIVEWEGEIQSQEQPPKRYKIFICSEKKAFLFLNNIRVSFKITFSNGLICYRYQTCRAGFFFLWFYSNIKWRVKDYVLNGTYNIREPMNWSPCKRIAEPILNPLCIHLQHMQEKVEYPQMRINTKLARHTNNN